MEVFLSSLCNKYTLCISLTSFLRNVLFFQEAVLHVTLKLYRCTTCAQWWEGDKVFYMRGQLSQSLRWPRCEDKHCTGCAQVLTLYMVNLFLKRKKLRCVLLHNNVYWSNLQAAYTVQWESHTINQEFIFFNKIDSWQKKIQHRTLLHQSYNTNANIKVITIKVKSHKYKNKYVNKKLWVKKPTVYTYLHIVYKSSE